MIESLQRGDHVRQKRMRDQCVWISDNDDYFDMIKLVVVVYTRSLSLNDVVRMLGTASKKS